jgi:uncharacterized protein with PIN domain
MEGMDEDLRNSLWSMVTMHYLADFAGRRLDHMGFRSSTEVDGSNKQELAQQLWFHHFKAPIDTVPRHWSDCVKQLRAHYFDTQWHEVFDLLEFFVDYGPESALESFTSLCNKSLERENSGYRIVDNRVVPITSEAELEAIETAIENSDQYSGVKSHLHAAVATLSDRRQPNYRNSIKESISAVEALAKKLTNDDDATLGAALKVLGKGEEIHPALNKAFSALYGYTNDAEGIRHALLNESKLTKDDAMFMLVACSAFVNYAIATVARR